MLARNFVRSKRFHMDGMDSASGQEALEGAVNQLLFLYRHHADKLRAHDREVRVISLKTDFRDSVGYHVCYCGFYIINKHLVPQCAGAPGNPGGFQPGFPNIGYVMFLLDYFMRSRLGLHRPAGNDLVYVIVILAH